MDCGSGSEVWYSECIYTADFMHISNAPIQPSHCRMHNTSFVARGNSGYSSSLLKVDWARVIETKGSATPAGFWRPLVRPKAGVCIALCSKAQWAVKCICRHSQLWWGSGLKRWRLRYAARRFGSGCAFGSGEPRTFCVVGRRTIQ